MLQAETYQEFVRAVLKWGQRIATGRAGQDVRNGMVRNVYALSHISVGLGCLVVENLACTQCQQQLLNAIRAIVLAADAFRAR